MMQTWQDHLMYGYSDQDHNGATIFRCDWLLLCPADIPLTIIPAPLSLTASFQH